MIAPPAAQAHNFAKAIFTDIREPCCMFCSEGRAINSTGSCRRPGEDAEARRKRNNVNHDVGLNGALAAVSRSSVPIGDRVGGVLKASSTAIDGNRPGRLGWAGLAGCRAIRGTGAKMSRSGKKARAPFRPFFEQLVLAFAQRYRRGGESVDFPWHQKRKAMQGTYGRRIRCEVSGGVMATALNEVFEQNFDPARSAGKVYRPSANEEFMNPAQLAYFRQKLLDWKESIVRESRDTIEQLKSGPIREPDLTDRASSETDWSIELRTRDRQRKLIAKIDAALRRIEQGEYGFCEVTGEPISLARLEARPIATMTIEAQESHERQERVSRDD